MLFSCVSFYFTGVQVRKISISPQGIKEIKTEKLLIRSQRVAPISARKVSITAHAHFVTTAPWRTTTRSSPRCRPPSMSSSWLLEGRWHGGRHHRSTEHVVYFVAPERRHSRRRPGARPSRSSSFREAGALAGSLSLRWTR